jgi:hypothetical protein
MTKYFSNKEKDRKKLKKEDKANSFKIIASYKKNN